jgi:uncharacterized protein YndB with AHSA1/START domain
MMSDTTNQSTDATARTERLISAPIGAVFAAFSNADRLAQWWGPAGFRNTFEVFEFEPGGRWVFTMHGPNGTDYPNESVFQEIEPNARIAIHHVSPPLFTLTVTLSARGRDTHLTWVQEFESAEVAARVRSIVEPANEQNLDRLQSLLGESASWGCSPIRKHGF